jgi:hypothetical protein
LEKPLKPSGALLSAALYGLTCAAMLGCGSSESESKPAARSDGVITSSKDDPDMTLEKFTAECDARGGVIEMHPHCGGVNTCKGMSYDETIGVLTEHTCKGLNTCAGYSCVVPS